MKTKIFIASSISLFTLFASSSFAAAPDFQSKGNWYAQLKGLYEKSSNVTYSEAEAGIGGGNQGDKSKVAYKRAYYNPGIDVSLGYFLKNGDDISLHYVHANLSTSHSTTSSMTPSDEIGAFLDYEKSTFIESYNSLAIRMGHFYNAEPINTHLFLGLDYTSLKQITTYKGTYPEFYTDQEALDERYSTTLNGIGPQIGFESNFGLRDHFSLIAGADMSVLASSVSSKNTNVPIYAFHDGTFHNTAFKTHANMGVGFQTLLNPSYLLNIELGYEGLYVREGSLVSSFSMQGPYLSFSLHGNGNA